MTMTQDAAKMAARLRQIGKQIPQRTADAMKAEAEEDMIAMKARTPVRTGTLRDSGTVHEPETHGQDTTVTLSFGDPGSGAEAYAAYVHEHIEIPHENGQSKFMESVLNESRSTMLERIGRKIAFKNW